MLSDGHIEKVCKLENRSEVTRIRLQHKMPYALNFYTQSSIIFKA